MDASRTEALPANEALVRPCRDEDMEAVAAIYAHHVRHGSASFEREPPSVQDMRARRAAVLALGFPYLVLESAGQVQGYAYAGVYRPRAAYRDTVENSVYLRPEATGRGFGRKLLAALIEACEACDLRQMIAVVGDSDNAASIGLHEKLGFRRVGVLRAVGYKHGRWLDSVLLQRPLGKADTAPPDRRG
jgi:phosphinothricin acetyltransferase